MSEFLLFPVIMDVGKNKKGQLVKEANQLVAYVMNTHYRKNPQQKVVILFDFSSAGVSNLVSSKTTQSIGNQSIKFKESDYSHSL